MASSSAPIPESNETEAGAALVPGLDRSEAEAADVIPEESTMGAVPVPGAGVPEAGTVPISAVDEYESLHASAHVFSPGIKSSRVSMTCTVSVAQAAHPETDAADPARAAPPETGAADPAASLPASICLFIRAARSSSELIGRAVHASGRGPFRLRARLSFSPNAELKRRVFEQMGRGWYFLSSISLGRCP